MAQEREEAKKKAYNMRNAKNKPKYNKYSMEDEYDHERAARAVSSSKARAVKKEES